VSSPNSYDICPHKSNNFGQFVAVSYGQLIFRSAKVLSLVGHNHMPFNEKIMTMPKHGCSYPNR